MLRRCYVYVVSMLMMLHGLFVMLNVLTAMCIMMACGDDSNEINLTRGRFHM